MPSADRHQPIAVSRSPSAVRQGEPPPACHRRPKLRLRQLAFELGPIPPKDAKEKHAAPGIEKRLAASAGTASTTLTVRYNGILPDMFAEGRDVIVEGTVQDGVFHASTLLTTCPSKYEAEITDPDAAPAPGERVASG